MSQSDPSAEELSVKQQQQQQLINKLISPKSTKNIKGLENDSLRRCLHYVFKDLFFSFRVNHCTESPCVCSPSVVFDILLLFLRKVFWTLPPSIYLTFFFLVFSMYRELLSAVNKVKIKPQTAACCRRDEDDGDWLNAGQSVFVFALFFSFDEYLRLVKPAARGPAPMLCLFKLLKLFFFPPRNNHCFSIKRIFNS